MKTTDDAKRPLLALVFWRKIVEYAGRCQPVILTLDADGTLSLTTADQKEVFRAPLNLIRIRFSSWGTLVLVVEGRRYVLVASGGAAAPLSATWQRESARRAQVDGRYVKDMRGWQDAFVAAGAPLLHRSRGVLSVWVVAIAAVLLIGLIIQAR